MSVKTIKLVQGGGTPSTFESEAETWGEFKSEIRGEYNFPTSHTAILGETVGVLINESKLPDEVTNKDGAKVNTYHVFITPAKSKSGKGKDFLETSYKECKALIKKLRGESELAKDFFGDYTHMSTAKLREMLTSWYKSEDSMPKTLKKGKKVKKDKKGKKGKKVDKIFKESVEKVVKTKKISKELVIETNQDVISTLEAIIAFLKTSKKGSKVVFTLNEVTPEDYKTFAKFSK